jgi:DNA-binding XRE family transcriptional regulator
MGQPQIIETLAGEKLAVIPLDEYQRLVSAAEDASDLRAYDEAKRRLAAGEDELVPEPFATRLLNGENPIRVWRELRGMDQSDLARSAAISPAFLSQIEGGQREGKVATLKALATALRVSIDDLV